MLCWDTLCMGGQQLSVNPRHSHGLILPIHLPASLLVCIGLQVSDKGIEGMDVDMEDLESLPEPPQETTALVMAWKKLQVC